MAERQAGSHADGDQQRPDDGRHAGLAGGVDGVRTIARGEALLAPAVTRCGVEAFAETSEPDAATRAAFERS